MPSLPVDPMGPTEVRLAGRVRAWTELAVVPFDPVAVVRTAAASGGRPGRRPSLDAAAGVLPWRRHGTLRLDDRQSILVIVAIGLLLAGLLGAAWVGGRLVTTPAPLAGTIAFAHAIYDPAGLEPPSSLAIFSVSSDGGEPTFLADVPGTVAWKGAGLVGPVVRWSPDGSRIAFRLFNDEAGIWVMDPDGSDLRRIVALPLDDGPDLPYLEGIDWSPDGTQIAYTYPYDGMSSPLYLVDAETGRVRNLTGADPGRGATRALAWSPDGTRIAFARTEPGTLHNVNGGGNDGLFVMSADGTGEMRLTGDRPAGSLRALTWAPNGAQIAFVWESYPADGPVTTLKVIGADGRGLRDLALLARGGGCCFFESTDLSPFAWPPSGERIALVLHRGFDQPKAELETIKLFRADGSGWRDLTLGSFFSPSPEGARYVVAESRLDLTPGPYSIYVINADGTDRRWLADGEYPAWSPLAGR